MPYIQHLLYDATMPTTHRAAGDGRFLGTRRAVAGLSALGAANMGLGALRQLGLIGELPDPPIPGFDSNKVLMSRQAFVFGIPDAPIATLGLLANVPLALAGGRRRDERFPLLPIGMAAKAIVEVSVAAWYLVQMRTKLHTWCAYCLLSTSIMTTIAVLTVNEARAALGTRRARALGALSGLAIAGLAYAAMSALDARRERQYADR